MVTLASRIISRAYLRRPPRRTHFDTVNRSAIAACVVLLGSLIALPGRAQTIYGVSNETRSTISLADGESVLGIGAGRSNITSSLTTSDQGYKTGTDTITIADAGSADTITRSSPGAESWITDGFEPGQCVTLFGTLNNDKIIRREIATVTAEVLTLMSDAAAVSEGPIGGSLTGTPTLTFVEGGAWDSITRSAGSWTSDGFRAGQRVTVINSVSNNVTSAWVLDIPTATELRLRTAYDLTPEVDASTAAGDVVGVAQVWGTRALVESASPTGNITGLVKDVRLDGNQTIPVSPQGQLSMFTAQPAGDGIHIKSSRADVRDCELREFHGTGIRLVGSSGGAGQVVMFRADFNALWGGWTGIEMHQSDASSMGNVIVGMRDYGIQCALGGAMRLTDNHCYGMHKALAILYGATAVTSVNDMYADSEYGMYVEGGNNTFQNTRLYHNSEAGAFFNGGFSNAVYNPQIVVARSSTDWPRTTGIVVKGGGDFRLIGGYSVLDNTGSGTGESTCVELAASDGVLIDNHYLVDSNTTGNARGIVISGLSRGARVDVWVPSGFENVGGTTDAVIKVNDPSYIKGCKFVIHGWSTRAGLATGFDHLDEDQYISLEAGWDDTGADANTFTIIDETTNQSQTISVNKDFDP